jgi:L-amino acid N-acyltransferase YncA
MRLANAEATTAIAFDMGALRGRPSRLRNLYACSRKRSRVLACACRGRGIGRAVLASIEQECVARGVRELWLTVSKGFVMDDDRRERRNRQ